ncbi:MAG: SLC13/DASS family transporter [Ignavibacteria bacterium]|nr:SLC13/DASS family transporter [Ignavibacteria bacterium]
MQILNPELKPFQIKFGSLFIGIFLFLIIWLFVDFGPNYYNAKLIAAVAAMMATWWITEALPLAATSLVPLILFPFLGVVSSSDIAEQYMNSTIFLFVGGFFIAIAMEKWKLHQRIALSVILLFGNSPSKIILGFMIASGFISMWISNTATCLMVLPIGLSIIYKVEAEFGTDKSNNFSKALMLAIAYACTIGGIATLIGTPPNLIFQRMYKIYFPDNPMIRFSEWMMFGVPLSITMLIITWIVLTKVFYRTDKSLLLDKVIIRNEKVKLGKMSFEEKAVLIVFFITSFLWVFRTDIDLGFWKIPGWSNLFTFANLIDDSTIAILMTIVLFVIPSLSSEKKYSFILVHEDIKKIPWDIVLLFGGGFALAEGFVQSNLSKLIGQEFLIMKAVAPIILVLVLCSVNVFTSELTSNTAQTAIILPLLASLSIEIGVNPLMIMIPVTFSVSLAFMMPVGTPPNAIVFGSQRLKVWDMAKVGFILNILGIIAVVILAQIFFI